MNGYSGKLRILKIIGPLLILATNLACSGTEKKSSALEEGFASPPKSTEPAVYWYWISDAISKEGITRDLEAMAKVGIGAAYIGNVDANRENRGSVKALTNEWWGMVEHAVKEGTRIGVDIGFFNSPGWSQSGGPWVKPEQSMRYVNYSETKIKGPAKITQKLDTPSEDFQDIAVLALPVPAGEGHLISDANPTIKSNLDTSNLTHLFDGDLNSGFSFPEGAATEDNPLAIDVSVDRPFQARTLLLYPDEERLFAQVELQAKSEGSSFRTIESFTLDRRNTRVQLGPLNSSPIAITFPPVVSKEFRLVFRNRRENWSGGIREIEITSGLRLERYAEKQLGKLWQTPLPLWDAYLWPNPEEEDSSDLVVAEKSVLNISSHIDDEGFLRWEAPPGDWIVLRLGMTPTYTQNAPATPEATGLEIDKMNQELVKTHFDAYVGELLRRLTDAEREGFTHVIADSYEQGSQNWTDDFHRDFAKVYGYDPLPWLAVLSGRVVGSVDQSERFLWDLRRLIADRISSDYVGGLQQASNEENLRLWLENYGHWGFIGEFLQYGGFSDEVGGEFWVFPDRGKEELRAASSAAHTYAKQRVSAEAFTTSRRNWMLTPHKLRKLGDWAQTEGINHFVLHVYIHQPSEDAPGINAWFGTEFNRHNTWFKDSKAWIDYLKRSHFLLQQGQNVADVAYFIGEDVPKMTGILEPALPDGYAYDFINADVVINRLEVEHGKFVLPDGTSYELIILPPQETMTPELLEKLYELVSQGGRIYGPKPVRSPSLKNFPTADRKLRDIADKMWEESSEPELKSRVFAKGDLQSILNDMGVEPDIGGLKWDETPWVHRSTEEGEIYYISNQLDQAVELMPNFRVSGLQPELWDAATGERRELPDFEIENGRTSVPLKLDSGQSLFVVFRNKISRYPISGTNFPSFKVEATLEESWQASYKIQPEKLLNTTFEKPQDWREHSDFDIRHFSGTAIYETKFDFDSKNLNTRYFLDLGNVSDLAKVRLNGNDVGIVWTNPWRIEVTDFLTKGTNDLVIEVTNTWANRIIGDAKLPPDERIAKTIHPHYDADDELLPAGLHGPVTILSQ